MFSMLLMAILSVSPNTGNLVINADKPFALYVDGRQVNAGNLQTSWTVHDLPAGRHAVMVESWPSPFKSKKLAEGYIDIPGGTEVRVKAEPNQLAIYESIMLLPPPPPPPPPTVVAVPMVQPQVVAVQHPDGQVVLQAQVVAPPPAYVVVSQPPPPPPPPAGPIAMDHSAFEQLKDSIEDEGFREAKLAVLKTAVDGGSYFTAMQLGDVLELYAFRDDKLKALRICHHRIIDRQNNHMLIKKFDFSDDKKEAQKILR